MSSIHMPSKMAGKPSKKANKKNNSKETTYPKQNRLQIKKIYKSDIDNSQTIKKSSSNKGNLRNNDEFNRT